MARQIREEALLTLQGRGAILDVARLVTESLRADGVDGAIIDGVAVVLHGHVRTTADVDVFAPDTERVAAALRKNGFAFDQENRQFVREGVPVHLVTAAQLGTVPSTFEEIDGIRTVTLADLIDIKLRTGTRDPLRAQDLADVIGLIRANQLNAQFARRISKELRPEFRTLVRTIKDRSSKPGE